MAEKIKIHEIAKELGGVKSKEVIEKANEIAIEAKSHMSTVTTEQAEQIFQYITTGKKPENIKMPKKEESKKPKPKEEPKKPKEPKQPKKEKPKPSKENKVEKPKLKKEEQTKKEKPKPKKEEQIKKEETKEKNELEQNTKTDVKKRRGKLMIIKKKNPNKKEQNEQDAADVKEVMKNPFAKKKNSQPLATVLGDIESKKKKKIKKTAAEKRVDSSSKMDISFGDLGDIKIDTEEEMVVLPDFGIQNTPKSEPKPKKSTSNAQNNYIDRKNKLGNNRPVGISRRKVKKKIKKTVNLDDAIVKSVTIPEEIRLYEFAEKIKKQPSEIIKELFLLGVPCTKNDFLDKDTLDVLAETFEIEVNFKDLEEEFNYLKDYEQSDETQLSERAPIITIMGHVDHGKTSLLDYIRSSKVASGEAGGITQHVGAYMVSKNDRNITFIDTPGHEAFTQMRSRGAQVTDICIVVVAADDGVKPQTKEAIEHAKAANVPIIIAINKMDKPTANPDLAKSGLAELGITPTDWGGEHEFVEVSAKTGQGIDDLLEIILLQADVLELKANANKKAKATVIESSVEKGRGSVATVVVNDGTLHVGDTVVVGTAYGKVRAMLNDMGKKIEKARPGEPVAILGLSEAPGAGEVLASVDSDKIAREYAQKRASFLRQKELSKSTKVTLDELSSKIAEGAIKTLRVIIKADVQGSLEAIKGSLAKIKTEETKIDIIGSGVGGISESDIALASASENCVIFGFNIRPTGSVKEKAKKEGIQINTYNIIYDLIDDAKDLVAGMLSPIIREENIGQAEIREVFSTPVGNIAGCIVTDGSINRGVKIRLIREGVIVYESTVSSLKRFKDDVKEVAKGYECGVGIEGYNDIKVGDFIESFKEIEEKAKLD